MVISELGELVRKMQPVLVEGKYFIASVDDSAMMSLANYLDYIVDIFREKEGLSVVFRQGIEEELKELSKSDVVGPFAMITLNVYSDPMAVGFLAKITEALAAQGISVNAFSAYHHDHLLVPYEKKDDAILILKRLSNP